MQEQLTLGYGLCECGCGQRTNLATSVHVRFGYTKGEPLRFLNGHNVYRKGFRNLRDRFDLYTKVEDRGYKTPCVIWQGSHSTVNGYGLFVFTVDGRRRGKGAHRWLWEYEKGPVPPGFHLDHLCRQRNCVNLEHLEPVTPMENTRRGLSMKVSAKQAEEIYQRLGNGERTAVLAGEYGVSRTTINRFRDPERLREGALREPRNKRKAKAG